MTNSLHTYWDEMPAVRWLLALLAGIGVFLLFIVYDAVSGLLLAFAALFAVAAAGGLFLFLIQKNPAFHYRFRYLKGSVVFAGLAAVGFWLCYFHTAIFYSHHFSNYSSPNTLYTAMVNDPPVIKEKSVVAELVIQSVRTEGKQIRVVGKVIANFTPDSQSIALRYGDVICFRDTPTLIEPPKNPNEFDYKSYQQFHNINHRHYLKSGYWQRLSQNQGNALLTSIYRLRQHLHDVLFDVVPGKNERAVATALLGLYDGRSDAGILE